MWLWLTRFVGISIEIIFHGRRWIWRVLLMPDGGASLLLVLSGERSRHLWVAVVGDVVGPGRKLRIVIVELLVMMMSLWHHVVLLVGHMDGLRRIIVPIKVSVRRHMLRMRNELVVLMEGGELHWRPSRSGASEGRWVREGQWGRFWTFSQFSRLELFEIINGDDLNSRNFCYLN